MRGTRLWLVIGMIAALFATALVAGCGDDDDDDATTEETTGASGDFETIEEGVLTVGTDAPYPPFLIGTPEDADFTGYEIELFNAIAEKLGTRTRSTRTRTSRRSSATPRTACSTSRSSRRPS